MAVFVATDYSITINGTNFSTNLTQAELSEEAAEVTTTAFGSGWNTRIAGLKQASLTLAFNQDFGAASIDATISPLLGSLATVVIKPTSGTASATNPSYTGTFLVTQYTPFSASVGDLATLNVTWPSSGTVTRATS